jgi:hypothetical protein
MVPMVEHLCKKHEALNSNPTTAKTNKQTKPTVALGNLTSTGHKIFFE